jgi:hypothetical protein
MNNYKIDTLKWLQENIIKFTEIDKITEPSSGKILTPISYIKKLDMLLVLYKTNVENEYCAHASQGDEWPDSINPPLFGFSICSSYDDALKWLAISYDNIRNKKYK